MNGGGGAAICGLDGSQKSGKHPIKQKDCPDVRLFVSASLHSQVLLWGHSSHLACQPRNEPHPGAVATTLLLS